MSFLLLGLVSNIILSLEWIKLRFFKVINTIELMEVADEVVFVTASVGLSYVSLVIFNLLFGSILKWEKLRR